MQLRGGRAPDELAKIRTRERGRLEEYATPGFDGIVGRIRSGVERLKERAAQPKNNWQKKHLPEYLELGRRALADLERFAQEGKIFSFDALVYGKHDHALGYGEDEEIGIARELLGLEPELLAEYVFHLALCRIADGSDIDNTRRFAFRENYESETGRTSRLDQAARELIYRRAGIHDGVDHRELIEGELGAHPGTRAVLTDATDFGLIELDYYELDRDWQNESDNMFRSDDEHVLYGDFNSVSHTAWLYASPDNARHRQKRHIKTLLTEDHGITGVWDAPEELNAAVSAAVRERDSPILVDIIPFMTLCRLHIAGYADAPAVIRRFVLGEGPIADYEEFERILSTLASHQLEVDAIDSKEAEEQFDLARDGVRLEKRFIRTFCGLLPAEALRSYIRRCALTQSVPLYVFEDIFEEERDHRNALWAIYLDESNTSEENDFLRGVLVDTINTKYAYSADPLWEMFSIFQENDLNKTHKAIDVLIRLDVKMDRYSDTLFLLLQYVSYKKEIAAAFCLLNSLFFGVKEAVIIFERGKEDPSPVTKALSPEARLMYFFLRKVEEARRRGGAFRSETDGRIYGYAKELDDYAGLAGKGPRGYTWFSSLRSGVHQRVNSGHRDAVRAVLRYFKDNDAGVCKSSKNQLASLAANTKYLSHDDVSRYSAVLNATLLLLQERGLIRSLENDTFLDEMLKCPEEEVIAALNDANPDAGQRDRKKVEYMIGIFYALTERFDTVEANIIPSITGDIGEDDRQRQWNRERAAELASFMANEHRRLVSVITTDDHPAVLSAIANCRDSIRRHILFDPIDDLVKTKLLDLDHKMLIVGKEAMAGVLEDIKRCETLEDLNDCIASLVSMAKFLRASGLGANELGQFIIQLEHGRHTYSQLHNLVHALRSELHKMTRTVNESIQFAGAHILRGKHPRDLKAEWRENVRTEERTLEPVGDKPQQETVISEEGREELLGVVTDGIIQDTGIFFLDEALERFNDILETQLTVDNDRPMSVEVSRTNVVLDDHLQRFGARDDIVPHTPLLSMWSKKGNNLSEMSEAGMPVPPGVIASAELMTRSDVFTSPEFRAKIEHEIELLQRGEQYPSIKLLLYARSGSAFTLPGLLVSIPNLGMNDTKAEELEASTGDKWFAYDTYAEFIRAYSVHILGIPEEYFGDILNVYEKDNLDGDQMEQVCRRYKDVVAAKGKGQTIPNNMLDQVMLAVQTVYSSWDCEEAREYRARHRISQNWGTVVILQKSVFGNLNPTDDDRVSGAGYGALKMLPDGREAVHGRFRFRSSGDQVMGRAHQNYVILSNSERTLGNEETLEELRPDLYRAILDHAHRLHELFGYRQNFEFTIELNNIWLTQSNDDVVRDDYPEFVDSPDLQPIARGHGTSGGALRGWVADSFEEAERLLAKYEDEKPADVDGVILFLERLDRENMYRIPPGTHIVARIISVHAETFAQQHGITAVYGVAGMEYKDGAWYLGEARMANGMTVSIDGHENQLLYHNSGKIFLGGLPLADPKLDSRAEAERLSPRAMDRLRELKDREQYEAAMARRHPDLTGFELEAITYFMNFAGGTVERDEEKLSRYFVALRMALDKIARRCENIDFELYGEAFKSALDERLSEMGVSYEQFMRLQERFNPYGPEHRAIVRQILQRLTYRPAAAREPRVITAFDTNGRAMRVSENDLYGAARRERRCLILHPPKRDIRLISLEVDQVIENLLTTGYVESVIELFKTLKSMGLLVAITSRNPSTFSWFNSVRAGHPEIDDYVDYCFQDPNFNPNIRRYVTDLGLGLEPGEIMHIGNMLSSGHSWDSSYSTILHSQGFVSVLATDNIGFYPDEVLDKEYDALLVDTKRPQDIIDLVSAWVNVSPEAWDTPDDGPAGAQDSGRSRRSPAGRKTAKIDLSEELLTVKSYSDLSGKDKQDFRRQVNGRMSDHVLTELVDPIGDLEAGARELLIMVEEDARIVALGRTPMLLAWTASMLEGRDPDEGWFTGSSERYVHAAFSGTKELFADADVAPYRKYLEKVGLDPISILNALNEGRRTVIVDWINNGDLMSEFLNIIIDWAEELEQKGKLKSVRRLTRALYIIDLGDGFIRKKETIARGNKKRFRAQPGWVFPLHYLSVTEGLPFYLANINYNEDLMGFYFPPRSWDEDNPTEALESFKTNDILKDLNLLRFWVIDNILGKTKRARAAPGKRRPAGARRKRKSPSGRPRSDAAGDKELMPLDDEFTAYMDFSATTNAVYKSDVFMQLLRHSTRDVKKVNDMAVALSEETGQPVLLVAVERAGLPYSWAIDDWRSQLDDAQDAGIFEAEIEDLAASQKISNEEAEFRVAQRWIDEGKIGWYVSVISEHIPSAATDLTSQWSRRLEKKWAEAINNTSLNLIFVDDTNRKPRDPNSFAFIRGIMLHHMPRTADRETANYTYFDAENPGEVKWDKDKCNVLFMKPARKIPDALIGRYPETRKSSTDRIYYVWWDNVDTLFGHRSQVGRHAFVAIRTNIGDMYLHHFMELKFKELTGWFERNKTDLLSYAESNRYIIGSTDAPDGTRASQGRRSRKSPSGTKGSPERSRRAEEKARAHQPGMELLREHELGRSEESFFEPIIGILYRVFANLSFIDIDYVTMWIPSIQFPPDRYVLRRIYNIEISGIERLRQEGERTKYSPRRELHYMYLPQYGNRHMQEPEPGDVWIAVKTDYLNRLDRTARDTFYFGGDTGQFGSLSIVRDIPADEIAAIFLYPEYYDAYVKRYGENEKVHRFSSEAPAVAQIEALGFLMPSPSWLSEIFFRKFVTAILGELRTCSPEKRYTDVGDGTAAEKRIRFLGSLKKHLPNEHFDGFKIRARGLISRLIEEEEAERRRLSPNSERPGSQDDASRRRSPSGVDVEIPMPDMYKNRWIAESLGAAPFRQRDYEPLVRYISHDEFVERLRTIVLALNEKLKGYGTYGVLWDENAHSSKRWVYSLAAQWLDKPPAATAYATDAGWEKLKDCDIIVVLDDIITLGLDMWETGKFVHERDPSKELCFAVPCVGDTKIFGKFREVLSNIQRGFELIGDDESDPLYLMLGNTLPILDHKIPDLAKTYTVSMAVDPSLEPYKVPGTAYYEQEEYDFALQEAGQSDDAPDGKAQKRRSPSGEPLLPLFIDEETMLAAEFQTREASRGYPYYLLPEAFDRKKVMLKNSVFSGEIETLFLATRAAYEIAHAVNFEYMPGAQIYAGRTVDPKFADRSAHQACVVQDFFGESIGLKDDLGSALEESLSITYLYSKPISDEALEARSEAYSALADQEFGMSFVCGDIFRLICGNVGDSHFRSNIRISEDRKELQWIDFNLAFSKESPDIHERVNSELLRYLKSRYKPLVQHGLGLIEALAELPDDRITAIADNVYGEEMAVRIAAVFGDADKWKYALSVRREWLLDKVRRRKETFHRFLEWLKAEKAGELKTLAPKPSPADGPHRPRRRSPSGEPELRAAYTEHRSDPARNIVRRAPEATVDGALRVLVNMREKHGCAIAGDMEEKLRNLYTDPAKAIHVNKADAVIEIEGRLSCINVIDHPDFTRSTSGGMG
ncbi:hypothetical protein ACFL3N_02785, partial [Candidatus Omnitrophota bacterium]